MTSVAVIIATIPPREILLQRAIRSVAAQRLLPDEVIVQRDEVGEGAGPTRNRAIARARSEYLAILDDDDELLPAHLFLLTQAAEFTDADVIYSWFELVDDNGERLVDNELGTMYQGRIVHPLGVPFQREQAEHMRSYAWIPACLMLRRQMVLDVGGYPPPGHPEYVARDGCEDWALLIRMLDAGAQFCHVPQRTWRLHKTTATTAGRPWKETPT